MVCDLIDPASKSWKADVISAGFNRDDVTQILSIPLSISSSCDRLVWHHTVNEDYSVKTGYGVAVKLMENGALGKKGRGVPSEYQKQNQVWNKIWCLQVKDKDKADEILQEFAFGLWRLYKNRNEVVFNGLYRQPIEVLATWRKNKFEFRDVVSQGDVGDCLKSLSPPKIAVRLKAHWQKLKFGFIKINTDAAWCKNTLRVGVGWVGWDFAGLLQAARGLGNGLCHTATVAEACAIRDALKACIDNRFDKVIIESDAKVIIQMLKKEISLDFSIECILGDIELLVPRLTSVTFTFMPGESNRAAHSVAKFVLKEGRVFAWDCIGPDFLFNILA
ncbi:uncharacterized protein [Pyrus communis]|uniref:uncharacterized protein n=1 Tax=Pyrus communis TaxID=23211 RepID=UPI0035C022B8